MELEDTETFEINDFTNATNWESFISQLEDLFSNLENISMGNNFDVKTTVHYLKHQNLNFNVGLYSPKINSLNNDSLIEDNNNYLLYQSLLFKKIWICESEFEHDLDWNMSKWFGKMKYICIIPISGSFIYGYDDVKLLLNSITIAISNIKCHLPVLVKHGSKNWPIYDGVLIESGFKVQLQSTAIKYTPKQCSNLCGIRRVFQQKLGKCFMLDDDIELTAKYLYRIDNSPHNNPGYFTGFIQPAKQMDFFQYFTMGFSSDPIKEIKLWAHWPSVPKPLLVQSSLELLPISSAYSWFLSCVTENTFDGIMYRSLRKLLKAFLIIEKPSEILQDHRPQDLDSLQINRALMKLTNAPISNKLFTHPIGAQLFSTSQSISAISLNHSSFVNNSNSNVITNVSNQNNSNTTLLEDRMIQRILLFLFPDVPNTPVSHIFDPYKCHDDLNLPNYRKLLKKLPKCTITCSMFHRIAICLTNILNQHKDGLKCLALIWMEVVLELRYRFENGIPLPSTRSDPDYDVLERLLKKPYRDTNLVEETEEPEEDKHVDEIFNRLLEKSSPQSSDNELEQQIQLINYCILARRRNEYVKKMEKVDEYEEIAGDDDNEEEDEETAGGWEDDVEESEVTDEFFECKEESSLSPSVNSGKGQLRVLPYLFQLQNPSLNLYVPVTQVLPVTIATNKPYSDDSSKDLITGEDESTYNPHTASLVSDMSAFKAANPGCCIEDFIRWYSPRDFGIEHASCEDEKQQGGGLSRRMRIENNQWHKCWNSASAMPVRVQKRLFDETVAAETALKYLRNVTCAQLASGFINNVLMEYLASMVDCLDLEDSSELVYQVDEAALFFLQFLDSIDVLDISGAELEYYQPYDDLIGRFQRVEHVLATRASLRHKFSKITKDNFEINEIIQKMAVKNEPIEISRKTISQDNIDFIFQYLVTMQGVAANDDSQANNHHGNRDLDSVFGVCGQQEYIIHQTSSFPLNTHCRSAGHRLYACIGSPTSATGTASGYRSGSVIGQDSGSDEFRLASVIYEDLTYF